MSAPIWVAFSFFVGIVAAALYFALLWAFALFGRWTLPACLYAAICMAALAVWCSRGGARARVDAFLSGVLTSGAAFAISLILVLILLMGSLGALSLLFVLVPCLCVWIYARSAASAFESACGEPRRMSAYVAGLVAAPTASGVLLFATVFCSNTALARLRSNEPASADPWVAVCTPLIGNSELPGWIDAYDAEIAANTPESLARAERISDAHRRITGTALPLGDSDFLGPAY